MTIIELLEQVGLENVEVQPLLPNVTNINTNRAGVSKITFETKGTNATEIALGKCRKAALIIWIPVEKMPKV